MDIYWGYIGDILGIYWGYIGDIMLILFHIYVSILWAFVRIFLYTLNRRLIIH